MEVCIFNKYLRQFLNKAEKTQPNIIRRNHDNIDCNYTDDFYLHKFSTIGFHCSYTLSYLTLDSERKMLSLHSFSTYLVGKGFGQV